VESRPQLGAISRTFVSTGLGYDSNFTQVPDGTSVHGYFQTFKYAQQLRGLGSELDFGLPAPGSHGHDALHDIRSQQPIVLHVRRGDYRSDEAFGLVGPRYYRLAVKLLRREFGQRPVWVFSDDPAYVLEYLPYCDRLFGPELDATSTLQLMTQATAIVIANSSLSWWGAWLQGDVGKVVVPDPWFGPAYAHYNMKDMIPKRWIKIDNDPSPIIAES